MRSSNNLEKKIPSDINWGVKLVCMKDKALSSSEIQLEYNHDQILSRVQGF